LEEFDFGKQGKEMMDKSSSKEIG
jgi:hypothetical protein